MLGPSNRSAPRSCGPERSCVAKSLPQQRAAETANLCRCRKSQLKQLRDRQQNMRIEQLSGEKERLDFERRYAQHMLAKVTWRSPSVEVPKFARPTPVAKPVPRLIQTSAAAAQESSSAPAA